MGRYYRVSFKSSDSDYLAHYGILGQQWGVRRFQNPDGSYTAEGKERYGRVSSGVKKRIPEVKSKQIKKDFDTIVKSRKEYIDFMKKQDQDLIAKQNSLITKYSKYLEKQKLSDADRESMWNEIHESAKDYDPYEDKDFFYDDVNYAIENAVRKMAHDVPDNLKKDVEKLENEIRAFRNSISSIAKPLIDKYEGQYVKDVFSNDGGYLPAYYTIDDFIQSEFRSPFLYPSYYPASDSIDRWILNSKAFSHEMEKLTDRIGKDFTIDEYVKRFGI